MKVKWGKVYRRVCSSIVVVGLTLGTLGFSPFVDQAHAITELKVVGNKSGIVEDDILQMNIPIDFGGTPFKFFGDPHTTLTITDNGFITFDPVSVDENGNIAGIGRTDSLLQDKDLASNFASSNNGSGRGFTTMIAPFWEDFTPTLKSHWVDNDNNDHYEYVDSIYYTTLDDKFIVQWTNVYFFGSPYQMGTFQLVLYKGSNEIQFRYRNLLNVSSGTPDRGFGSNGAVGIHKDNSNINDTPEFNEFSNPYRADLPLKNCIGIDKAIRFIPNGPNHDGSTGYTMTTTNAVTDPVLLVDSVAGNPSINEATSVGNGSASDNPTLAWNAGTGTNNNTYSIIIADNADMSNATKIESGNSGTDTSLTKDSINNALNALDPSTSLIVGKTYYWQVIATNDEGVQTSDIYNFRYVSTPPPAAPASVAVTDNDTNDGIDGRDFTVTWTPSSTGGATKQRIYIIPAGETLNLSTHTPVDTITDNSTGSWTGTSSLTTDSAGNTLAAGSYKVYVVAENDGVSPALKTASAAGTITLTADTAVATKSVGTFSFSGLSPVVTGTVNTTANTIELTVPYGTDVTALVPTITHNGTSVSPNTGVAQDFTSPVTYTVTASDNTTQQYAVTVTVAAPTGTGFLLEGEPLQAQAGGFYASVKVVPRQTSHVGNETVVFQLMKGNVPIAIQNVVDDITQPKPVHATFSNFSGPNYKVKAFVRDQYLSGSNVGTSLANAVWLMQQSVQP